MNGMVMFTLREYGVNELTCLAGKEETPGIGKGAETSTPAEQLLSDEEFARQLAREDEATANNAPLAVDNEPHTIESADKGKYHH